MSEQTPVTDQAQQAASSTPQEASTAPAGEETTNAPQAAPAESEAASAADSAPADKAGAQEAKPGQAAAKQTETALDPEEALAASKWGRVDGEGNVYVQDGETERLVGQFPGAPVAEAMAFYIRRYLDLKAQVALFATRLPHLSVRDIDSTVKSLSKALKEPAAVGDLNGLRAQFDGLKAVAKERREVVVAERAAARAQALAERTKLVEESEALAGQDPTKTHWRNSMTRMREILNEWKAAQQRGPRLDRATEDALWQRFSGARSTLDRNRRQFFNELDEKNKQVVAKKEALIKRAEELSTTTDWERGSRGFRDLMSEWKQAGRTARRQDDALWERFHAAQQVFFKARQEKDAKENAELTANLKVKEELAAQAEALLPIKDIKAAKRALRPIQDRWEAVGYVPRNAMRRIEGRMRAVEEAIREAERNEWRRTDPETKARAEGLAGQLEASSADLEAKLEKAKAEGKAKAIAEHEAALNARRAWLDQVRRSTKA